MGVYWRALERRFGMIVLDVGPPIAMAAFLVTVGPVARRALGGRPIDELALLLLAGAGLALVGWRPFPLIAYAASLAFAVAFLAQGHQSGPIILAPFAGLLVLVARRPVRVWLPAAIIGSLALALAETIGSKHLVIGSVVAGLVWIGLALLFGLSMRARRRFVEEQQTRDRLAARTKEAEALQRMAEERLRIAREVHDVVGHSMAIISLQAGVAEHLLGSRPQEAQKAIAAIRKVSREALTELRVELATLRGDRAPAPASTAGLYAVPELVASMRNAGLRVDLDINGSETSVPEGIATVGYRIVQESLTNVARHAGVGARAKVRLEVKRDALEVEVLDDGVGANGAASNGSGLRGMRDRTLAHGGRFEAGNRPGRGFRVWAELPWHPE